MTRGRLIAFGVLILVIILIIWLLSRRSSAGGGGIKPLIEYPDGQTGSLELSPEVEQEIEDTAYDIIEQPVPTEDEVVSPTPSSGTNTIVVKGTNWRADTKQWTAMVYDAIGSVWLSPSTIDPDREGNTPDEPARKTWVGLDEQLEFTLNARILKTKVRIIATIADMTAPIAQSGLIDVTNLVVVSYDDGTKLFS